MALPSSGPLSISAIRNEEVNNGGFASSYSLRQLSSNAGKSTPDSISEFYGYSASTSYYKYGSPFMLFDFASTTDYSNSGTAIKDLSGNANDGVFVTGTGKGSPTTVNGYSSTAPGTLRLNNPDQGTGQYSVRLVNTAQFNGTQAHTMVAWVNYINHNAGTYPGIFSSDQNPYGWEINISNENPKRFFVERFGAGAVVANFGSDLPAFAYNTWYMASLRYNGTAASIDLYMGGTRYTFSANIGGISTSDSYGPSMGLRYNDWINGYFGYAAGYTSDIGTTGIDAIYNATKARYGY
jgi:hypothetical protein